MNNARPHRTSSLRWKSGDRNKTVHGFAVEPCKSAGRVYSNNSVRPLPDSFPPPNNTLYRDINEQSLSNGPAKTPKEPTCSEDLHATGLTIEYKTGLDTFRFPTPSPRPASSTSPRFPPWTPALQQSPLRSPYIGMAMGSPSHAPPNWGRSNTSDCVPSATHQPAPTRPSMEPRTQTERPTKLVGKQKKGSGWRSLGGLFRKTTSQDPSHVDAQTEQGKTSLEAFLHGERSTPRGPSCMAMPSAQNTSRISHSPHSSRSRATHSRNDSRGDQRTSALPAPQAKLKKNPRQRRPSHVERRSPRKEFEEAVMSRQYSSPMKEFEEAKVRQMIRHDSPFDTHRAPVEEPTPTVRAPKLDCDIPRPEMDRYSVMFSQLLDMQRKPSLLERRQSRMSRLMQVGHTPEQNDSYFQSPPPRSSTPPPPMPRPMSINVERRTRASTNTAPARRPPQELLLPRTYTAPPPLRPAPTAAPVSLTTSPSSALYSEPSLPPTPTTATTCTTTLDFPTLVSRDVEGEHTWLSPKGGSSLPPTTTSTSSIGVSTVSTVSTPLSIGRTSPTDTLTSRPTYPRIKSPADLERQIVQVSVARQVSVSRARTRVQQALPSKQPLKPRVVNLSGGEGRNRKSEVGLLVGSADGAAGEGEGEGMPVVGH
ncbi:unnamed protein product [Zymoseptoria tritici ST99CH_1E4]|uniref:Uncharacterized protein n=1 Tax=Zymoseptoria tritici ST99CH_1E4 TaxID=1276532 RepID=A0A2H1FWL3_ZYMTR|nr:unnamed protein product [Zymoseptoria tritici ST99CH_1E4]